MNKNVTLIEPLLVNASAFLKTNLELLKLKAVDKLSELVSTVLPMTFIIVVLITALFFLNIGLALWLGDLINSMYGGFLLVGLFYSIVAIVFRLIFYRYTKRTIRQQMIKSLLN
jgi:hypothetical protein